MPKCLRVGVVLAALAVCALSASSVSAAEWHTNGTKAFTSTPAGALRFVFHPSGSIIACTGASYSGTINGPTSTAFPWVNAATIQPVFTGCSVGGAGGYVIACATSEIRAMAYAGGTTFGTAGGGVTTMAIRVDCSLLIGPSRCSTITGTVPAHYINPNPINTGASRLTVTTAGQALGMHQITACAGIPFGSATIGSPGAGSSIHDFTYTADGPAAPWIFRTP
jgi:hypothetical protein